MSITLMSPVFNYGEMIPSKYTCDGENISPPLRWWAVPPGTMTFVLISDDPDAPMGTWVHWVLFNIPVKEVELPEGIPAKERLDNGALHGITDFKSLGYGGPAPPSGTHHYFFKLYALNITLDLPSGATKKEVMEAMKGRILGQGELMGTYKRR
ncbi:MAG: YbhB/YbcL family Raf kinase inhibitor-like protein [Candidatus Omnitrophica bacterium]|nr:YbhB/YbcL family Raf kinase inhibitor-like protein [Candidatus Omnitrophota bacterium]